MFIKQFDNAKEVINIGRHISFSKSENKNRSENYQIDFVAKEGTNTWFYESEADRDRSFRYICELIGAQSIGS